MIQLFIRYILKILLLVYEYKRNGGKDQQVCEKDHEPDPIRMHPGRDGTNHIAGLRQGQYRDYLAKTIRHLLRGEKSITEEGHRHNNIGIKPGGIRVTFGQKGQYQSKRGEYRTI